MPEVSPDAIRQFIITRYADFFKKHGLLPADIPRDFDLLVEGVVDSLGVIELIAEVEEHFNLEVDFEDFETDDLTRIGPFSEYVSVKKCRGVEDE